MKRKVLWAVGISILIVCVSRYIEVRTRQTDPNWQIAEEIYKVEAALKEVDKAYECQPVSRNQLCHCVQRGCRTGIRCCSYG